MTQDTSPRPSATPIARPALAFLLPFLLYRATAAPTVFNLDSAELTTAAVTGGLVHATGYPLYLLCGRAWLMLPFDDPGRAMNLMSAFLGAFTILLLDRVLRRLGVGLSATFFALGLLATGFWFWGMSLIAEVYTLQTALLSALLLALLHRRRSPTLSSTFMVGLMLGLGLANHMTMVLLVPACLAFLIASATWRPLWSWAAAGGGVLAGSLMYLELVRRYLAQPDFNYLGAYDASGVFVAVDLTTWQGFAWLLSGRAFSPLLLGVSAPSIPREFLAALGETVHAFSGAGLGPVLIGMVVLWRRDRATCWWLILAYVAQLMFFIPFGAHDKQTMMIVLWVPLAVAAGVGFQWLLDWLASRQPRRQEPSLQVLALVILGLGTVLLSAIDRWPRVDLSMDTSTPLLARVLMLQAPPGALAIGGWETASILHYYQQVEGLRQDLEVINRFHVKPTALASIVERELSQRPVLTDRQLSFDGNNMSHERRGLWFQVHARDSSRTTERESDSGSDR